MGSVTKKGRSWWTLRDISMDIDDHGKLAGGMYMGGSGVVDEKRDCIDKQGGRGLKPKDAIGELEVFYSSCCGDILKSLFDIDPSHIGDLRS
ncbi:hypothetical protein L7F22_010140 [Adiantum nelumboides]|nr:hypothetical protein [Adiantum nelumboides]